MPAAAVFCVLLLLVESLEALSGAEQKRNTPYTRQSNYRVDYTAYQSVLPTCDPSDDVKLEKTDATPIQRADYGEDERDSIHNHRRFLLQTVLSVQR